MVFQKHLLKVLDHRDGDDWPPVGRPVVANCSLSYLLFHNLTLLLVDKYKFETSGKVLMLKTSLLIFILF